MHIKHSFSSSTISFLCKHSVFQKKSIQRTRKPHALNLVSMTKVAFDLAKKKGEKILGRNVLIIEKHFISLSCSFFFSSVSVCGISLQRSGK